MTKYRSYKPSLKTQVVEWVEKEGPKSHHEILNFLLTVTGRGGYSYEKRGWYSSYFSSNWGGGLTLLKPSRVEPRYLKKNSDGLYSV